MNDTKNNDSAPSVVAQQTFQEFLEADKGVGEHFLIRCEYEEVCKQ